MNCPKCSKRMHYMGFSGSSDSNVIEETWECENALCSQDTLVSRQKVDLFLDFTKPDKPCQHSYLD